MRASSRSLVSLVAAVALVAATASPAFAARLERDRATAREAFRANRSARLIAASALRVSPAVVPTPMLATTTPDAWDSTDGTYTTATTLTALPVFNATYRMWPHTISSAATGTTTCDEDWFKLEVTTAAITAHHTYLFEAFTRRNTMALVIELYRADGGGAIAPTPPYLLPGRSEAPTTTPGGCVASNDMGYWGAATFSASLSFTPTAAGTYYLRVRPHYDPVAAFANGAGAYEFRAKIGQVTRLAGSDRYKTAVAISREQFPDNWAEVVSYVPEIPTVVVANGLTFADSLPAAALAYAADGPLLLLPPGDVVPAAVRAEILRLRASRVIIVGGTAVVTSGMARALDAIPGVTRVERVAGTNRFKTAVAVANRCDTIQPSLLTCGSVFVVNGNSFPEALIATPMSGYNVAPIMYTGASTLDGNTAGYLSAAYISDAVIVGNTSLVSTTVENQLKSRLGSSHVRRISGADRYETARNFAVWSTGLLEAPGDGRDNVGTVGSPDAFFSVPYNYTGLASGQVFPDALAGGAFAGYMGAPMLLNTSTALSRYIYNNGALLPGGKTDWYTAVGLSSEEPTIPNEIERSYIFGGTVAISAPVASAFDRLTGPGPAGH